MTIDRSTEIELSFIFFLLFIELSLDLIDRFFSIFKNSKNNNLNDDDDFTI